MVRPTTSRVSLVVVMVLLLTCGVALRLHALDRKFFWEDEAWTALRLSGYFSSEVRGAILSGSGGLTALDVQRFQRVDPERGVLRVLIASAADPKQPPLYFLALWAWARLFGDSVGALRAFSVVASLLAIPCVYWLCLELFRDRAVAVTAGALLAVSPLHVVYAQEARAYSWFVVMMLLSSVMLLRALRLATRRAWVAYALTIACGLFVHLLMLLVVCAHTLYVAGLAWRGRRADGRPEALRSFVKASSAGLAAFLPWTVVIAVAWPVLKESVRVGVPIGRAMFLDRLLSNISTDLVDTYGLGSTADAPLFNVPATLIHLSVLGLVCYALYVVWRETRAAVWLFIASSIGTTACATLLPDLILGGRTSTTARYTFPYHVAVELAVAFLLAKKMLRGERTTRWLFRAVAVVVVIGVLTTSAMSARSWHWWNKGNAELPQIATILNTADRPELWSDVGGANLGKILALSHALDSRVTIRLAPNATVAKHVGEIPRWLRSALRLPPEPATARFAVDRAEPAHQLFLMDYSGSLLANVLRENFAVLETVIPDRLWRIARAAR